eukprot:superscaffoldBa00002253_g13679
MVLVLKGRWEQERKQVLAERQVVQEIPEKLQQLVGIQHGSSAHCVCSMQRPGHPPGQSRGLFAVPPTLWTMDGPTVSSLSALALKGGGGGGGVAGTSISDCWGDRSSHSGSDSANNGAEPGHVMPTVPHTEKVLGFCPTTFQLQQPGRHIPGCPYDGWRPFWSGRLVLGITVDWEPRAVSPWSLMGKMGQERLGGRGWKGFSYLGRGCREAGQGRGLYQPNDPVTQGPGEAVKRGTTREATPRGKPSLYLMPPASVALCGGLRLAIGAPYRSTPHLSVTVLADRALIHAHS